MDRDLIARALRAFARTLSRRPLALDQMLLALDGATDRPKELLVVVPQARGSLTAAARPAWLVTHYEQVWRDYEHHTRHAPDLLIIDEAQRAKRLATRTARVLKAIDARHVFALTGTPLENRLEEAYAIAQLVDQRLLPPLWQLDRDHFVRDEAGRRVVMYRGLGALRSQLAPRLSQAAQGGCGVGASRARAVGVALADAPLPSADGRGGARPRRALGTAVSAVAGALPPEHRASLAAVFRAVAAALDVYHGA